MNNTLLILLLEEYHRLLELDNKRKQWEEENPDKSKYQYKGKTVSSARLKRLGVMIRQMMVDVEDESRH